MDLRKKLTDRLATLAPAGFYVGLRLGFAYPAQEINRLPGDWTDYYARSGLIVQDPVFRWVYARTGVTPWAALAHDDPSDVFGQAAAFGLRFGAVVSVMRPGDSGRRSYGTFARSDRAYGPTEMAELLGIVTRLHVSESGERPLTRAETEALRMQADGLRLKEISAELDISMSAVKARLANAKRKLGAATTSQATSLARCRGVI
ncbi:hypothetical protein BYZ73_18465 [Rhodovulum viride]|nr:LuxR C-terminal-related transcriptional regulator [Rhodovulum viride]RAP39810.1 hypothetical protein BYZ73_18465 [Rhodovulum viride]